MADTPAPETLDLVSLLRTGEAPPEIRRFAARGVLPLDADGQISALLAVLEDPDPETAEEARATFSGVPPDQLSRFLESADASGIEVDTIARYSEDSQVLERVIRHRSVDDQTMLRLARTVTGTPQDALVVNQVRMLRLPALIDALFENPGLTAESRRRLNEIREEFFEKQRRRREAEELRRRQEEQAARAEEEGAASEAAPGEGGETAGTEAVPSEEDLLTTGALYRRIGVMTVQEKINLAYGGGKEERRILIGDSNRLVGQAVLKSRGLTINEVESFCAMRHLDDEIFRQIALKREWMRNPAVIQTLVKNPSVPIALTLPLVKRLGMRDLKSVMNDANLPEGIRVTARRLLTEKRH
ncbi:MAG: hypothetical protein ACRD3M_13250 [Thermoanaerobaculia bacterium]